MFLQFGFLCMCNDRESSLVILSCALVYVISYVSYHQRDNPLSSLFIDNFQSWSVQAIPIIRQESPVVHGNTQTGSSTQKEVVGMWKEAFGNTWKFATWEAFSVYQMSDVNFTTSAWGKKKKKTLCQCEVAGAKHRRTARQGRWHWCSGWQWRWQWWAK